MKKLILLLSVVALLTSCETKNVEVKNTDVIIQGLPIQVYVIDSCEYIGYFGGNSSWGSHKGTCKFCEKRNRQMIQEEIQNSKNNY